MDHKEQSKNNRKLAVILFADIQGYTAIMQSDEGKAMNRLRQYQTVLKEEVDKVKGEIIKNYGDGSLCLFSSVLEALRCSKNLQHTFQNDPVVPVRIGIHLGDVVFEENDIYGNDINIASRIESMGIAGSILISRNIYEKVRNQSEFEFKSLGSFEFKNVKEPMEIFALTNEGLAVPSKGNIQGKFKEKKNNKLKWALAIIAVVAFLGIQIYSNYRFERSNPQVLEADSFEAKKVAVLPFLNTKSDEDTDYLG
ncbi:MAG: adenylate/guanylate cyclase domain-containing protein, partial [Bacteroidia bacterium]|nr:adenylate/guanylate cyclase domain-containing protein [Bacteroidia bacterium]